jgi:hypothetical protein
MTDANDVEVRQYPARRAAEIRYAHCGKRLNPSRSTLSVCLFADALKCRRWCYGATDGITQANPRLATLEPLNTANEC